MSVQSQIDRINENVASTYNVLNEAGADMPGVKNTNNLPETAASIKAVLYGKQQNLTEEQQAQARDNIGVSALIKNAAPRNLLDNSDFRNPVNQRGVTTFTGIGYTIDRWQVWNETITVGDGFINSPAINQFLELPIDKVYTLACCAEDGTIAVVSGTPAQAVTATKDGVTVILTNIGGHAEPIVGGEKNLIWAALYEGEYTAETLPEYQPKGYGAELYECRRYYREDGIAEVNHSGLTGMVFFNTPYYEPPMRVTPTYTIKDFVAGMGDLTDGSAIANAWGGDNRRILLSYNSTGVASQCSFTLVSNADL